MEMYILDSLLRRTWAVDKFESLIWTERWHEAGDFELDLKSTLENRTKFMIGTRIAINDSYRVMTVETVEDKTDAQGKETFTVKGRSLEALLEDRVVKETMSDLTTEPKWILTDTPANVVRTMFDHICRPPAALHLNDAIPFITPGTIFPADTIPESVTAITWEQSPASLYNAIQNICKMYDLGFRIVRNFDLSELYFDVYSGNDRTTRQSDLSPVVFSVGLDNIQNTTEFLSIDKSKNVAYVFSDTGYAVVYADDVDPDVDGFDRRVLVVNANVDSPLVQQGNEALLKSRGVTLFDGEVNQRTEYTYGVDYELGDLVEMRNKDGVITYKRVTEQIFVSDATGERAYPTLVLNLFTGANTWASWTYKDLVWVDFTTEVWADM